VLIPAHPFNPAKPEMLPCAPIHLEKNHPSKEETWFTWRIEENSPWNGWFTLLAILRMDVPS
jgi:hypothetical protein